MSNRPNQHHLKRRGFIAAGLLTAGAGLGLLVRRSDPIRPTSLNPSPLDNRFAYDLSQFETTDPALLRYSPSYQFETGLSEATRIAVAREGIWVVGKRTLKLFGRNGQLQRELALTFKPHCICPLDRQLLIGARNFLAIFDHQGSEQFRTTPLSGKTYFTAVALHEKIIYAADAGNREIAVFDYTSGELTDRFGKTGGGRDNPGFAIPSPYFDLRIAPDQKLRIANTGRTRIETYSLDGRFESAWGEAGMQIDRFCGCCNPVFFTLTSQGDFITSEKGLARVNIYSASGHFKGAVAGPDALVKDKELARRACVDCRIGAGFDVAVDEDNSVFVLDPFRKTIRCFTSLAT